MFLIRLEQECFSLSYFDFGRLFLLLQVLIDFEFLHVKEIDIHLNSKFVSHWDNFQSCSFSIASFMGLNNKMGQCRHQSN